jgi:hypothetical protein
MQYTLQQPQEIIGSNELTPNLQPGQPKYVSTKHLTFYQQNGPWMVLDYSRFSATFKKVNAAEHLPAESKLLIGKLLYQVSY